MFRIYYILVLFFTVLFLKSCGDSSPVPIYQAQLIAQQKQDYHQAQQDSMAAVQAAQQAEQQQIWAMRKDSLLRQSDDAWVDIADLDTTILLDIRYATTNNFMEMQVYECGKCFMRVGVAKAVLDIQEYLRAQNFGLKMFDCYRPSSAQHKLWKKVPDPRYVAPPKRGSVHSRGAALDLTIVDSLGKELDMGTPYDYFGKEAYWSYKNHPKQVLENKNFLRTTMEQYGFKTVTTEWWHYNYARDKFALSNMQWTCQH